MAEGGPKFDPHSDPHDGWSKTAVLKHERENRKKEKAAASSEAVEPSSAPQDAAEQTPAPAAAPKPSFDQVMDNLAQDLNVPPEAGAADSETAQRQAELTRQVDEDLKIAGGETETHSDDAPTPEEIAEAVKRIRAEKEEARRVAEAAEPGVEHMSPEEWKADQAEKKTAEDRQAWREHFGPLAEAQEEAERAEQKKAEDRKAWREHFGPLAEAQEEAERLQGVKPTAETADKILAGLTPEQRQILETGAPTKLTPEQQRGLDGLKAAAEKQKLAAESRAESKGFLGIIKNVGEAYNRQPTWKKLLIGGGLLALGIPGATIPQKILSGCGMYVTLDTLLQNKLKDHPRLRAGIAGAGALAFGVFASQIYSAIDQKLGISDTIRGWFTTPAPVSVAPPPIVEVAPPPPPIAEVIPEPPAPPAMEIFGADAVVGRGDTVWRIAEQQLNGSPEFMGLDRAQKDFVLDSYMKHMQSLGKSAVQSMGIGSGDINTIRMGEHIRLDSLNDRSLLDNFLAGARNLAAEQKENILRYRRF